jgi:hypothetical protein
MTPPRQIQTITAALTLPPTSIEIALSPARERGLPPDPGFYAWWARDGSLPGTPAQPHPTQDGWGLLYVGIAPVRSSSKQRLRSRVAGNHLQGNTGASTFRLSLAALLLDDLDFHPFRKGAKVVLPASENRALSTWQRANLRITWVVQREPWTYEPSVIDRLQPPLNLAGNTSHPFHQTMSEARAAFRAAANNGTNR